MGWGNQPEVVDKHPIMFQESVNGTHPERLELYNPLNNTEQDHLCNSQPEIVEIIKLITRNITSNGFSNQRMPCRHI